MPAATATTDSMMARAASSPTAPASREQYSATPIPRIIAIVAAMAVHHSALGDVGGGSGRYDSSGFMSVSARVQAGLFAMVRPWWSLLGDRTINPVASIKQTNIIEH